ncbi:hypothetical protein ACA910_006969 [Epithemia clementina (nom. ined.)]
MSGQHQHQGHHHASSNTITQDYYDELCVENQEVFDLSEEEAVMETEQQIEQQRSSSSSSTSTTATNTASSTNNNHRPVVSLHHLSRTFPTSPQGLLEREKIREFQKHLQFLSKQFGPSRNDMERVDHEDDDEDEDDGDKEKKVILFLDYIQQQVSDNPLLFLSNLQVGNGFFILVQLSLVPTSSSASSASSSCSTKALETLRHCLEVAVAQRRRQKLATDQPTTDSTMNQHMANDMIGTFQAAAGSAVPVWLQSLHDDEWVVDDDVIPKEEESLTGSLLSLRRLPRLEHLLTVLWFAVKQCESNKKSFMRSTIKLSSHHTSTMETSKLMVSLVDRILLSLTSSSNDEAVPESFTATLVQRVCRAICRIVTSLCTFEPELIPRHNYNNKNNNSNEAQAEQLESATMMTFSSAHETVLAFYQAGFVVRLQALLQRARTAQTTLAAATRTAVWDPSPMILALRSLAIHNDVVQTVVSVGLLKQACELFLELAANDDDDGGKSDWVDKEAAVSSSSGTSTTTTNGDLMNQSDAAADTRKENCNDSDTFDTTNSEYESNRKTNAKIGTIVAIVGLFRNVCANDDIKTLLCLGSGSCNSSSTNASFAPPSIVEPLVQVMTAYPQHALLQEHGCGTIAAMALRKPYNAQVLVLHHQVHVPILQAMRNHPKCATLQRQAALALRNLVSRDYTYSNSSSAPGDEQEQQLQQQPLRPILSQAGAEQVLLQIAAQHASCQDEVYAALRDLGIQGVGMVNVHRDEDTGQVTVKRTEMFGEAQQHGGLGSVSNFRPVYD